MGWGSFFFSQCAPATDCTPVTFCCHNRPQACEGFEAPQTPMRPEGPRSARREGRGPDSEGSAGLQRKRHLEVPSYFQSQTVSTGLEAHLDQAIRSFVLSMQSGVETRVLLDDGTSLEVETSLDFTRSRLLLRVQQVERDIPLADIERISGAEDPADACTTNKEHLSELCATLVLSSTHFLTFEFETVQQRLYFQTCLNALVASQRQKAAVRPADIDTSRKSYVDGVPSTSC